MGEDWQNLNLPESLHHQQMTPDQFQEILKIITTSYEEGDPQSKKTADMQSCLICLRDYLHNQEAQFQPLSQIPSHLN